MSLSESQINKAVAEAFEKIAKNATELKADLLETVQEALQEALANYTNRRPKAHNLELVDGALLLEWTDDGQRFERFAVEVKPV